MPLPVSVSRRRRFVDRLRELRKNPIAAYAIALSSIALAIVARFAIPGAEAAPFITFYPAMILATLVGGLWPGLLALGLSTLAAWFFFLPHAAGFSLDQREAVALLLFVLVAGTNLALVLLLNSALDRVTDQARSVQIAIESAPNGILVVDQDGVIRLVNASIEKMFGYTRAELMGQNVDMLVPERVVDMHRTVRRTFLRDPEPRAMGAGRDLKGRRKDGQEFPVEIGLNPLMEGSGQKGVLSTVIDISERKSAESRQQLLIGELQHRTNNLLAVIQSMAGRSFSDGQVMAVAKQRFISRLMAIGRAYKMLADAAWEGASLADIVRQEMDGFSDQVRINGCDVILEASAAQRFALVIHELATNATKHGALSVPQGRITIDCSIVRSDGEPGVLSFIWKERDGPSVSQPQRKGFGSTILLDTVRDVGESATMNFDPSGLTYELKVRLGSKESSRAAARNI